MVLNSVVVVGAGTGFVTAVLVVGVVPAAAEPEMIATGELLAAVVVGLSLVVIDFAAEIVQSGLDFGFVLAALLGSAGREFVVPSETAAVEFEVGVESDLAASGIAFEAAFGSVFGAAFGVAFVVVAVVASEPAFVAASETASVVASEIAFGTVFGAAFEFETETSLGGA